MNQRLQQTERFEETSRLEPPLTDHTDERSHYDTYTTSDTATRYGNTERVWWQEQINGPRGVRLSAALSFGLLHTLSVLVGPVSAVLTLLISRFLSEGTGAYIIGSIVLETLAAVATGFMLRRVAPRNAIPGAAIAAGAEGGLSLVRWLVYWWQWTLSSPVPQVHFFTPFRNIMLLDMWPAIVLVLTVVALEKHDRYKRTRER